MPRVWRKARRGLGAMLSVLDGQQIDPSARGVDAVNLHAHAVADPDRRAAARAVEDRALLVELPPFAAQLAHRQHPLVAVAEEDERAGADHAGHLALVRLLPALLEQLALEQERARDVVGGALDAHRVALARRAPVAGARQAGRSRGLLPAADGAQQRAVADEVGVAADRRGEVAVVREPEPGVAEV